MKPFDKEGKVGYHFCRKRVKGFFAMVDHFRVTVEKYLKVKLEDNWFSLITDGHYPGYLLWTSDKYWLLVVLDKIQVFADVGRIDNPPRNPGEFDLWTISQFLGHTDFPRDYTGSIEAQVKRIAQMLLDHWDEIFTDDLLVKRDVELRAYLQKLGADYKASRSGQSKI